MFTELKGFRELARELDDMDNAVAGRIGAFALRKGARQFGQSVAAKVPVGKEPTRKSRRQKGRKGSPGAQVFYDFGHWRDNVKVRRLKNSDTRQIDFSVSMGEAFWSWIYEMGSSRQPARPIVRPLFDSMEESLLITIGDALGKGVTRQKIRQGSLDSL